MADYTFVAGEKPTAATWNSRVRDQGNTIVTSGTRPSSPVGGRLATETDTDKLISYEAGAGAWVELGKVGAWQSYTPTWTGATTNPTLNNGTISGKYQRLFGRVLLLHVDITAGSTTTFGTGQMGVTLPAGMSASWAAGMFGGIFSDSSSGLGYDLTALASNSAPGPQLLLYYKSTSGANLTLSQLGGAAPVAMATSDSISINAILELTS